MSVYETNEAIRNHANDIFHKEKEKLKATVKDSALICMMSYAYLSGSLEGIMANIVNKVAVDHGEDYAHEIVKTFFK